MKVMKRFVLQIGKVWNGRLISSCLVALCMILSIWMLTAVASTARSCLTSNQRSYIGWLDRSYIEIIKCRSLSLDERLIMFNPG